MLFIILNVGDTRSGGSKLPRTKVRGVLEELGRDIRSFSLVLAFIHQISVSQGMEETRFICCVKTPAFSQPSRVNWLRKLRISPLDLSYGLRS